jgi:hypothetical protein
MQQEPEQAGQGFEVFEVEVEEEVKEALIGPLIQSRRR